MRAESIAARAFVIKHVKKRENHTYDRTVVCVWRHGFGLINIWSSTNCRTWKCRLFVLIVSSQFGTTVAMWPKYSESLSVTMYVVQNDITLNFAWNERVANDKYIQFAVGRLSQLHISATLSLINSFEDQNPLMPVTLFDSRIDVFNNSAAINQARAPPK